MQDFADTELALDIAPAVPQDRSTPLLELLKFPDIAFPDSAEAQRRRDRAFAAAQVALKTRIESDQRAKDRLSTALAAMRREGDMKARRMERAGYRAGFRWGALGGLLLGQVVIGAAVWTGRYWGLVS